MAATTDLIDRVLRERLKEWDIPKQILNSIRDELIIAMNQPEKKPFGAAVMTAAASMAADEERLTKNFSKTNAKPEII